MMIVCGRCVDSRCVVKVFRLLGMLLVDNVLCYGFCRLCGFSSIWLCEVIVCSCRFRLVWFSNDVCVFCNWFSSVVLMLLGLIMLIVKVCGDS